MTEWPVVTLADAGVAVLDCEHRTPASQVHGHPYIAIPDIRDGRVSLENARRISDSDLASWTKRTRPEGGDIVVTRRGRVGDSAPIPSSLQCAIGQNLVLLRSSGDKVDQAFLRWAARSPQWWAEVERLRNVGAVFSSLNVRDIARIQLPLPPLETQRGIAEVLGALDDKIAANLRVVDLAGHLSDLLFKAASEAIPFGDATFGSLGGVFGGGTPSSKMSEYWSGDIPWAAPTDITRLSGPYLFDTGRKITAAGLANCTSQLYPAGSILMTSRATIGAFALTQIPVAVNQGFIVVVPQSRALGTWLFHEMRSRVEEFLTHANGATFLELSRGNFKRLPVRLPSDEVLEHFDAQARPLHDAAAAAILENDRLVATRDALLPALMSGSLRVKEVERLAEDLT